MNERHCPPHNFSQKVACHDENVGPRMRFEAKTRLTPQRFMALMSEMMLIRTSSKPDLVVDPIPFPDDSFEYVTAYDFLEHIPRLIYTPTRRNLVYRVDERSLACAEAGWSFLVFHACISALGRIL